MSDYLELHNLEFGNLEIHADGTSILESMSAQNNRIVDLEVEKLNHGVVLCESYREMFMYPPNGEFVMADDDRFLFA